MQATVLGLVVIAMGYVGAPLRYAGQPNRRAELVWMDRLIRSGILPGDLPWMQRNASYYLYVVLTQSYRPAYRFSYDCQTRTMTIRHATTEAPQPRHAPHPTNSCSAKPGRPSHRQPLPKPDDC